jgi:hypothetical protein
MRPLHLPELLRHRRASFRRVVKHQGNEESLFLGHVVGSISRKLPFTAEVAFESGLRMGGDDGYEQRPVADLFADLASPPRGSL